jgi:Fic family protein
MNNLGNAYDFILNNIDNQKRIEVSDICKLHSFLCENTYIDGGNFRTTSKVLEITVNGERMHAPDSYDIPYLLNIIAYNMNNPTKDILHRAFDAHYELIALQPFDDYNKRTARLVMNWLLVQNGYRPIVFNRPNDKQRYKTAIAQYASGDKKSYYAYMSQCMVRTQQDIIKLLTKSKTL